MTFNLLFLTITINKRKRTIEECLESQRIEKLLEEHKDRQYSLHRPF